MNSKEEQTNSEVTNLENESFIEKQKDPNKINEQIEDNKFCLLYTSPSPRDLSTSRMPSSA